MLALQGKLSFTIILNYLFEITTLWVIIKTKLLGNTWT